MHDPPGPVDDLPTLLQGKRTSGPNAAAAPGPCLVTPRLDEDGRYVVEEQIARGGMGAVLRARDLRLDRELAVKVLREDLRDHAEAVLRFLQEARIAARLQHPGIVPVYELAEGHGRLPFFTMKLVTGSTLAELLRRRSSPADDLPHLLHVFKQVCQTVAYAHSLGVIHRDLKPSNIMVGEFGEVQVMDWGLAKVLGSAEGPGNGALADSKDNDDGLTVQSGSVLGTPGYMAPEQARGQTEQVGSRADVFGLGAILCEVLTGAPAFAGLDAETACRMARDADLSGARQRLDRCGAEPELVELARSCLAAESSQRPADAGIVARAVTAYHERVAERLRQAETERAAAQARAQAERKARRLTAGVSALGVLLLVGVAAAGLWLVQRAHERRQLVERDLEEAARLRSEDRLADALAAARRAEGRLTGDPEDLRLRVSQTVDSLSRLLADREMVARLDAVVLEKASLREGRFDIERADPLYAAAFRAYGIDEQMTVADAVAFVKRSAIHERLVDALDDWVATRGITDPAGRQWLFALLREVDPEPWRSDFRDACQHNDGNALAELARKPEAARLGPVRAAILGKLLMDVSAPALALEVLEAAQRRHPDDFWLNEYLGGLLDGSGLARRTDAIAYLQAAVALRPHSPGAHLNLGAALEKTGQHARAEACFRRALDVSPGYAEAHFNLGIVLANQNRLAEAEAEYRAGLAHKPSAFGHHGLGQALERQGKHEAAVASLREALRLASDDAGMRLRAASSLADAAVPTVPAARRVPALEEAATALREYLERDPANDDARAHLVEALAGLGRWAGTAEALAPWTPWRPDEVQSCWDAGMALLGQNRLSTAAIVFRRAIALRPDAAPGHVGLGNVLVRQGKLVAAEAAYHRAAGLEPDNALLRYNHAILLAQLGRAADSAQELQAVIRLSPTLAQAHYALGNAWIDRNRTEEAVEAYRAAVRVQPDYAEAHCNLGHALRQLGKLDDALVAFRRGHEIGSKMPGWSYPSAMWLAEAEQLVRLAPRLDALRKGAKASNPDEALLLARLCQSKGEHAAAARFYREAFAGRPGLADDLSRSLRRDAARAAVRASTTRGEDAAKWRAQAREWLEADRVLWSQRLEAENLLTVLCGWQADGDFEAVRHPSSLAQLPEPERRAWDVFWTRVADMIRRAEQMR